MNKKKLLLLGSGGRVAQEFMLSQGKNFSIVEIGSKPRNSKTNNPYFCGSSNLDWVFSEWRPEIVVNLAARWGKNEPNEAIWQSNFEFPTSIATRIRDKTQWIQVDSYFNLYFDKYGVDKDYYSHSKRLFYESLLKHGEHIDPIQVIAPHLVGPHESQNRIFRVVTSALAKNESYPLSSGKQYLPFLHISDTVNQLLNVVTKSSFGDSKRVHLRISGQMTVHELVFQSHKRFNRPLTLAKFGEIPEPEAEFYEPVEMFQDHSLFPPPKIDLGQILDEQYQERLDERAPEN